MPSRSVTGWAGVPDPSIPVTTSYRATPEVNRTKGIQPNDRYSQTLGRAPQESIQQREARSQCKKGHQKSASGSGTGREQRHRAQVDNWQRNPCPQVDNWQRNPCPQVSILSPEREKNPTRKETQQRNRAPVDNWQRNPCPQLETGNMQLNYR